MKPFVMRIINFLQKKMSSKGRTQYWILDNSLSRVIFSVLSICFLLGACSDALEEDPYAISTSNFYQTADEIKTGVLAIYAPIKESDCFGGRIQSVLDAQTDYSFGKGSYSILGEFQGYNATNIGRGANFWKYFYSSINRANIIIDRAPEATSVDEETINELVAEAKFMRAFDYFQLVRLFGALPLRTEDNFLVEDVARSSVDEVYALIVSDLINACAYLPEEAEAAGRATKWAAKTLLADVYLALEEWGSASSLALEVIESGKYSLVEISESDDYYNIFGPDIISSTEEIFYLKYDDTYSQNVTYYAHPSDAPYNNYAGWGVHYTDSITFKLIINWDYHDLRKSFNLYNWDRSLGSTTTMCFKKFIDPERAAYGASVDYPCYRLADVLLIYAEASCRANGGPTTDGVEKLNMLHRRAYGYATSAVSDVDFNAADYTEDSFMDLVMKERMYELMYEGKRWFELIRTERLESAILDAYGIDVAEAHLLFPIPSVEYDYNDAIDADTDQNPGY